jgi:hypothetical protein
MPKTMWMKLACLVFLKLGAIPTAIAATLDSRDTIYIDGQPCGFCESVMAIPAYRDLESEMRVERMGNSERAHKMKSRKATASAASVSRRSLGKANAELSARNIPPIPAETGQAAASTAVSLPNSASADQQASQRIGEARSDTSSASKAVAEQPVDRGQQFAAMSPPPQTSVPANTAGPSTVAMDRRVAIIMTSPDIENISDLSSKNIAIDGKQSAWRGNVQAALVAAGASDVELTEGKTKALDRLIGGEVPAAVLAVLSPTAAKSFPDFAGFNIFKIPSAMN